MNTDHSQLDHKRYSQPRFKYILLENAHKMSADSKVLNKRTYYGRQHNDGITEELNYQLLVIKFVSLRKANGGTGTSNELSYKRRS